MSAIKNAFHNTICFQQKLMEIEEVSEELADVVLRMLDQMERLEMEKALFDSLLSSHVGLSGKDIDAIEETKEMIDEYKPQMSEEVKESWKIE